MTLMKRLVNESRVWVQAATQTEAWSTIWITALALLALFILIMR